MSHRRSFAKSSTLRYRSPVRRRARVTERHHDQHRFAVPCAISYSRIKVCFRRTPDQLTKASLERNSTEPGNESCDYPVAYTTVSASPTASDGGKPVQGTRTGCSVLNQRLFSPQYHGRPPDEPRNRFTSDLQDDCLIPTTGWSSQMSGLGKITPRHRPVLSWEGSRGRNHRNHALALGRGAVSNRDGTVRMKFRRNKRKWLLPHRGVAVLTVGSSSSVHNLRYVFFAAPFLGTAIILRCRGQSCYSVYQFSHVQWIKLSRSEPSFRGQI